MSGIHEQAVAYFSNSIDDLWRWAENGRVLVWADGTTIAFQEEIGEVLELLAPNGLPPFRAVMLLLSALRGKFPQPALTELATTTQTDPSKPLLVGTSKQLLLQAWNDPSNQEFSEFIARLRALHQLPAELRNSPKAKANLIETIFEDSDFERVQPTRDIIALLRGGLILQEALNGTRVGMDSSALERFINHRLRSLSADELTLRMRTGLDALPAPAELDVKPAEQIRELLAQLQADPEHEGLARVTRDVMAAIYLPRALSEMDELALGGFSDISNRGNLDRLLPSELAHDDLTLAVRIALNEALYFRREPPANHPPGRFAVLIDASVRMWGLPRVFATAVALALMGKEDRRGGVSAWRAGWAAAEKIDLLTRAGLEAHLGTIESYGHPGAAMKSFLAQFTGEPNLEAVLITQRDTLSDPEFQLALRDVNCPTFYIASVDRDGSFELHLHPHRHSLLCKATIPLESLFAKPRRKASALRTKSWNPELPLILSIDPFPILLPVVGKMEKSIRYSASGGIAVMRDRRVLRWETLQQGAETIIAELPKGRTLWLGMTDFGKKVHILKHLQSREMATLMTWNSVTNIVRTHEWPLPNGQDCEVWTRSGVLYIKARQNVTATDIESGEQLAAMPFPFSVHQRYVPEFNGKNGIQWKFLTYDGTGLRLEPVNLKPEAMQNGILALFDREGCEGPWAFTKRGEVYSHEGKRVINLGRVISQHQISPDGNCILVPGIGDANHFQCIDLQQMRCTILRAPVAKHLFKSSIIPPTINIRVRFDAIHLPLVGGVCLRGFKGEWWSVAEVSGKSICLQPVKPIGSDFTGAQKFESVPGHLNPSFTLKLATWPDGRRAWLDSRGLLHLKGTDSSRPEITLALGGGATAAWSSDGEMCGQSYYIPKGTRTITSTEMMQRILDFNPGG